MKGRRQVCCPALVEGESSLPMAMYWVVAGVALLALVALVGEFFARRRPLFSPRFWLTGAAVLALLGVAVWSLEQVAS